MEKKRIYAIMFVGIVILGIIIVFCNIFSKKDVLREVNNIGQDLQEPSGLNVFEGFYDKAREKLNEMTLEEKIGQVLLVRYPDENQAEIMKRYNFRRIPFVPKGF